MTHFRRSVDFTSAYGFTIFIARLYQVYEVYFAAENSSREYAFIIHE